MVWLVFALILLAGYATQRGGVCAVVATRELVRRRRPERFLAFLFCAAIGLTVLSIAAIAGRSVFAIYHGSAALLLPALGGALFGAGAWVNGACAFGTVAQLGCGRIARIATIAGFLAGSAAAFRIGIEAPPQQLLSPFHSWSPVTVLVIAGAAAAAMALEFRRTGRPRERGEWTPAWAMAVIGAVNALLLVLAAQWPYTNLLMDLAGMAGEDIPLRAMMALLFLAGSTAAAMWGGGFRFARGPGPLWLRSAAGGVLMALGAALVPGGNDTMLLVGLPLLLPNLLVAYAAMSATLALLELAAGRGQSSRIRL